MKIGAKEDPFAPYECIIKLALLIFDSFGIALNSDTEKYFEKACAGNNQSTKVTRLCKGDLWTALEYELQGYNNVKSISRRPIKKNGSEQIFIGKMNQVLEAQEVKKPEQFELASLFAK